MTSRSEVSEYLVEQGWIEHSDLVPDGSKTVFSIHAGTGTGEVQLIISLVDDFFFQVISAFAPIEELAAEHAFALNNSILGLTEFGGNYCLSFVAVNSAFSSDFFEEMKDLVGAGAYSISKSMSGS